MHRLSLRLSGWAYNQIQHPVLLRENDRPRIAPETLLVARNTPTKANLLSPFLVISLHAYIQEHRFLV